MEGKPMTNPRMAGKNKNRIWTAEMDDYLCELWKAGVTTALIASWSSDRFDQVFSRGSVIGRMHRLIAQGYGGAVSRTSPIRQWTIRTSHFMVSPNLNELLPLRPDEAKTHRAGPTNSREKPHRITLVHPGEQKRGPPAHILETARAAHSDQRVIDSETESHLATFKPRPRPPEPCCFVTNERRPWRYCDVLSEPGRVYCSEHIAITSAKKVKVA